jgi:hypothetical protein
MGELRIGKDNDVTVGEWLTHVAGSAQQGGKKGRLLLAIRETRAS